MTRRLSPFVGPVFAAFFVLASPSAARGEGDPHVGATTPPAPPGDGAQAETALAAMEAQVKGKPDEAVVREPVANARRALERAHGARVSGDTVHAPMLDALALEWTKVAETLLAAAAAERAASEAAALERAVATKLDRARVLLSETQARRGLVAAELEKTEADAKAAKEAAAATEAARLAKKTPPKKGGKP